MPSNVPKARRILRSVLNEFDLPYEVRNHIQDALDIMTRDPVLKRADDMNHVTAEVRDRILRAVTDYPHLPNSEIAVMAGLTSCASGRVTDAMKGKYAHLR